MKKSLFATIMITFLFTQTSFAHHLWIEKEENIFKVLWGHPPETTPYDSSKLKEAKAFDLNGKEVVLERKNEKGSVYLSTKPDVGIITVSFEGGYLITTPDGKRKLTKREAVNAGMQVIDSIYSSQYAKGLFAWSESAKKPSGLKFEIVPLKNPITLKANDILPIRLYFNGKPVKGATIETGAHTKAGQTDKNGDSNIKITKNMQIVLAKYRIPAQDNHDADFLSYTTVLSWAKK